MGAVVGTLAGVIAGGATNIVLERMRWSRDDQESERQRDATLLERRRERCIEFSSLADELRSRLWSFVDSRQANPEGWRTDDYVQKRQDALESAIGQFYRAFNELWILGMGTFRDEAGALHRAVMETVDEAFGPDADHGSADIAMANVDFLNAVAKDHTLGGEPDHADTTLTQTTSTTGRLRPRRRAAE